MSPRIHPQARTTPKIRQEIKDSGLSDRAAAKVFNITRATAVKWLGREDTQDRSHRALTQKTTLTKPQEAVVLSLARNVVPANRRPAVHHPTIHQPGSVTFGRSAPAETARHVEVGRCDPEGRGGNSASQEDLQELRTWLHPYRHQVFSANGGRIVAPGNGKSPIYFSNAFMIKLDWTTS